MVGLNLCLLQVRHQATSKGIISDATDHVYLPTRSHSSNGLIRAFATAYLG